MNGDWKNGKRTTEKKIKPMALFLLHNITINDACRLVVVVVVHICTSNWNSILEVICTTGVGLVLPAARKVRLYYYIQIIIGIF